MALGAGEMAGGGVHACGLLQLGEGPPAVAAEHLWLCIWPSHIVTVGHRQVTSLSQPQSPPPQNAGSHPPVFLGEPLWLRMPSLASAAVKAPGTWASQHLGTVTWAPWTSVGPSVL